MLAVMSDDILTARELKPTCPDNATLSEEIVVSPSFALLLYRLAYEVALTTM
jgi:hypothetical protein